MEERLPRKLAAILYADVAGYSRLTGEDEDATHRTLSEYLDFFSNTIEAHRGQVMHYAGDAVLAQFNAVLDVLSAAVAIQSEVQTRNEVLSDSRKVQFRMGVNLGDVIEDRGDIYGDGVNVAARLEALADPGGVCISDAVRTAIGNKLPFQYEFMGEHAVKNIVEPVRAYRLVEQVESTPPRPTKATGTSVTLRPACKASLFVKPFENLTNDSEQDYFTEGLTSDLMIALLKIPGLLRIVDHSPSETYSKALTEEELGREYGVRCVLRGGVRKRGDRVRINAELVEVATGNYLWAERFDCGLDDLFDVQDEITEEIATAMDVKLLSGEQSRFTKKAIKNPQAREYVYRADYLLNSAETIHDIHEAERLLEEAIRLEPTSGMAVADTALAYWIEASSGLSDTPSQSLERALELASEALRLGDTTGYAHLIRADAYLQSRDYDKALAEATRSIVARPNCNGAYALKANILNYLGRSAEAIELARYAVRLTPDYPPDYPAVLSSAYYLCGRYDDAIGAANASIALSDQKIDPYLFLAASSAALGYAEQAHEASRHVLRISPEFTVAEYAQSQPYKDPNTLENLVAHLHSAGL